MNENNFKKLNLERALVDNLESLGYTNMTQIQEQALPIVLDGDDIIARAKTGSGKTVAFGLGIINNLESKRFKIQTLVLCPTRELATQVANSLKQLARYKHNIKILTLTGGVPYKPQVHSLSHLAHIIVATPGRVLKHLEEGNFSCEDIDTLVLDEADRMLDMGFSEDINKIIDYLPKQRQTMLFSATYPPQIEKLASTITVNPKIVEVESFHKQNSITQEFYRCETYQKNDLVSKCFDGRFKSAIIFCNTKIACDELADYLEDNYDCEPLVLHSDCEQKDRDEILVLFANKSYPILIATDVAARGLDIDSVDLVINFDLPVDSEVYIHRIGRTARAGNSGYSISFVDDQYSFEDIQDYSSGDTELLNIDSFENKSFKPLVHNFSTLYINGGKRHKLRAGDILGALTAGIGLDKDDIGKIDIFPTCSYVAIKTDVYEKAYNGLMSNKMKNKFYRIYKR